MRASSGVTVLEAVATLALLALLLAVALPNLLPSPELEVRVAARELVAEIGLARQLAVSKGQPTKAYVVEFLPAGGPYTGYTVRPENGTDEPGFPKRFPEGMKATGPQLLEFLPSGALRTGAGSVDVVLSAGSTAATVRVTAATGYARVLP